MEYIMAFPHGHSPCHRRQFPNSNLSPDRPLSGTIPTVQSPRRKRRNRRRRSRSIDGRCKKQPAKIGPDIRNILRPSCFGRKPRRKTCKYKITRKEKTAPNRERDDPRKERKTSPKPIRRPPTSRRIRRRAARTYDRTVRRPRQAGRGNPSRIRPSAVFAPFRQSNHSMQRQGGRQRPSSSASAAIVATP